MAIPTPAYHFIYIAPGMTGDWLFIAARKYWVHFKPSVIASLDWINFAPPRQQVAITSLARRDTAQQIRNDIALRYPRAYHDPLVYDYLADMQLTLDGRAALNQRFGVPDAAMLSGV